MKKAVWDSPTNVDSKAPASRQGSLVRGGGQLLQALFPVLLATAALLVLVETLFKGSVVSYLNLDILLRIVVGTGVVFTVLSSTKAGSVEEARITAGRMVMIVGVGIGGAAIVWYETQELGWLSYVISGVSGGFILQLLISAYQGGEEREIEQDNQSN